MLVSTALCNELSDRLSPVFTVTPFLDGFTVHADKQICGSSLIIDIWPDLDIWPDPCREWHWRSVHIGDKVASKGTALDAFGAAEIAVQSASKYL